MRQDFSYERLEFLGDRVLSLVIAKLLLERFPAESEGDLAKRHAELVRRGSLVEVASALDLGEYLIFSRAEAATGARNKPAILADACEALIGALYLDGGMNPAEKFITGAWEAKIGRHATPPIDAKTRLQEWAQAEGFSLPAYTIIERDGPSHKPLFTVEVQVQNHSPVKARGPSKRAAERSAAEALLARIVPDNGG